MFKNGWFYVIFLCACAGMIGIISDDDTAWAILVAAAVALAYMDERDAS